MQFFFSDVSWFRDGVALDCDGDDESSKYECFVSSDVRSLTVHDTTEADTGIYRSEYKGKVGIIVREQME